MRSIDRCVRLPQAVEWRGALPSRLFCFRAFLAASLPLPCGVGRQLASPPGGGALGSVSAVEAALAQQHVLLFPPVFRSCLLSVVCTFSCRMYLFLSCTFSVVCTFSAVRILFPTCLPLFPLFPAFVHALSLSPLCLSIVFGRFRPWCGAVRCCALVPRFCSERRLESRAGDEGQTAGGSAA